MDKFDKITLQKKESFNDWLAGVIYGADFFNIYVKNDI